jgi:hypothetical protein
MVLQDQDIIKNPIPKKCSRGFLAQNKTHPLTRAWVFFERMAWTIMAVQLLEHFEKMNFTL